MSCRDVKSAKSIKVLKVSYFLGAVAIILNLEQYGWRSLKWMMWPPLILIDH